MSSVEASVIFHFRDFERVERGTQVGGKKIIHLWIGNIFSAIIPQVQNWSKFYHDRKNEGFSIDHFALVNAESTEFSLHCIFIFMRPDFTELRIHNPQRVAYLTPGIQYEKLLRRIYPAGKSPGASHECFFLIFHSCFVQSSQIRGSLISSSAEILLELKSRITTVVI